ncbi:MAG: hypothetical protein WCP20_06440 [Desulfuromonadales bacterium]
MFIKYLLVSIIAMLLGAGSVFAAEIDDAAVFVDAFNAFQEKDYLLAIEKANQLNQIFPDSPLKDVTLLLIARSSVKSGDNELAAKTVNKFTSEFSDSALMSTIEEELLALGARQQKGERLQPNLQLQAVARKYRDERIVLEKAEAERRERERLAAEKAAKESIKVAISVPDGASLAAAGQDGSMAVEISNRGSNSEEFLLEVSAAPEYGASLTSADKPKTAVSVIRLASGETFKGKAHFKMPADKVDGHRAALTIKAVSSKFSDVLQTRNALIIASAPLVRVVAKLAKPKVVPGEQLRYRVSVLNIGSLAAEDLTVRLQLPPQLDFMDAPETKFQQEKDGTLVFRIEQIKTGKMADISLDVKVKENSRIGQELRGRVEIVHGLLQRKDIFNAGSSVVQKK